MILIFSSCCEKRNVTEKMSRWLEAGVDCMPWTDQTSFHQTKQHNLSQPTWRILVRWTRDRWPACPSPGTWWHISSCPAPVSSLSSSCCLVYLWQLKKHQTELLVKRKHIWGCFVSHLSYWYVQHIFIVLKEEAKHLRCLSLRLYLLLFILTSFSIRFYIISVNIITRASK